MNIGSAESSNREHAVAGRHARHGHASTQQASTQQTSTQQTAVAARAEDQTRLTVRTAEGDEISISIDAIAQLAAASQTSGSGQTSQASTAGGSTEIKVSVKGDLSDAELKDLSKLIQSLGEIESGKANSLDGLSGLKTIAAFDYSHTRTVESGSLFQLAA